jgi:hypothetical protein
VGRLIGGIAAGIVVAFVVVFAIEMAGMRLFPPPPGMDPMNPESVRQYIGQMALGAFVAVLLSWTAGAFAGAWVTARVSSHPTLRPSLAVGGLFVAASLYNLVTIPHPVWFTVIALVLLPLAAWLGATTGRMKAAA